MAIITTCCAFLTFNICCRLAPTATNFMEDPKINKKGKGVPLHAMEEPGGRGGIAPIHSQPRHKMGVSGQHHAPAALYPQGIGPSTHWTGGWVGPRAGLDTEARRKILCLCRGSNPSHPVRSQSLY
jgi:hypothetical protein